MLCVAGGDGTVSTAVSVLVGAELSSHKIPLLAIRAGNANDLAIMLNGRRRARRPVQVLETAAVTAVTPLHCTLESPEATHEILATCYVGFGFTGTSAEILNNREHRGHFLYRWKASRFILETAKLLPALHRSRPFTVTVPGMDAPASLHDITIANAQHMS